MSQPNPNCPHCRGDGWYVVVVPVHHPCCDGTCSMGCPFPEQAQEQCPCEGEYHEEYVKAVGEKHGR